MTWRTKEKYDGAPPGSLDRGGLVQPQEECFMNYLCEANWMAES